MWKLSNNVIPIAVHFKRILNKVRSSWDGDSAAVFLSGVVWLNKI